MSGDDQRKLKINCKYFHRLKHIAGHHIVPARFQMKIVACAMFKGRVFFDGGNIVETGRSDLKMV